MIDELHPLHTEMMNKKWGNGNGYDRGGFEEWLKTRRGHISELLASCGYTGAYDHGSQIHDQIVIFNPKDARRIDAAYHPDKADSDRLLDDIQA